MKKLLRKIELFLGFGNLFIGLLSVFLMIENNNYLGFYYTMIPFLAGVYILLFRSSEIKYEKLRAKVKLSEDRK